MDGDMQRGDDTIPHGGGGPGHPDSHGGGQGIAGNKTGHICPQCGYDCWSIRYIEQPGGTLCLCTCRVCTQYAQTDGRIPPQIVVTEYPSEESYV